jgi:RimJ/RimL family protein N-acetyltransferase
LRGDFAIVDDRDAPVGSVALDLAGHEALCVGYWIARGARGQGLAARATPAVVRLAFDVVGTDRVILHAQPENTASRAVARRAAFVECGVSQLADGIVELCT